MNFVYTISDIIGLTMFAIFLFVLLAICVTEGIRQFNIWVRNKLKKRKEVRTWIE